MFITKDEAVMLSDALDVGPLRSMFDEAADGRTEVRLVSRFVTQYGLSKHDAGTILDGLRSLTKKTDVTAVLECAAAGSVSVTLTVKGLWGEE